MTTPIRVLLVEDLPADAGLAEREIRKAVPSSSFQCVDTREAFLTALADFQPDIVVTDYRMPRFDGMTAMKLSQEHSPLTPVIVLTSAINEDTAVECMKSGASDYVIKEHIKRLGQAVIHALEERRSRAEKLRTDEELRIRDYAIKSSISPIGMADLNGTVTYVNDAFCRLWKYAGDREVLGRHLSEFALSPKVAPEVDDALRRGRGFVGEGKALCADGSTFDVQASVSIVNDREGKPLLIMSSFIDISERKRAEEQLRAWHGRYELVAAAGKMLFYDRGSTDNTVHWSESISQLIGIPPTDAAGGFTRWLELIHPDDREAVQREHALAESSGTPFDATYRFRTAAGQYLIVHDRGFPVHDAESARPRYVGVMEDVTRAREMESALHLTQFCVDNASIGIIRTAADGRILSANDVTCRSLGYSREELCALRVSDIDPEFHVERLQKHHEERRTRKSQKFESVHRRKDGSTFPVEVVTNYVEFGGRGFFFSFVSDITERRRSEERIEEQARLLDVARDAIIVRDINDRLVYFNRAAQDLYGWTFEEALAIPREELIVEGDRDKFLQSDRILLDTGAWEGELRQKTKDGRELTIQGKWTLVRDRQGTPSAKLIINRDVTEQRRLELQFRRAQRLESLGTLAGGIAHDLNNVLAPITMSLDLLRKKITDPGARKNIDRLESSAQRGRDIVKQVLLFARGSEQDFAPQQLRYIIREITGIIHETFPRNIHLTTAIDSDLAYVMGDATQLHQVLMNLCVNARDAMPDGGDLTIAVSNTTLSEADTKARLGASAGDHIVLSITDTGTGIPRELQERIFEPFFTTKDPGKGTGLGLSTVYAIVKDHKGFIDLYSEPGRGTTFRIYIPAVQHEEAAGPAAGAGTTPPGHGELILVVDDEQAVLEISRELLEVHGYRVRTATNGAEAIAVFATEPKGSIRLVLTDVNMPVMDGPATVEAIRRLDPDVRVIIASGLVGGMDESLRQDLRVDGYLMKPYTSERMLAAIYEALGEKRS